MSIELKVPDVGESVQEVEIGRWLKQEGDRVEQDEDVVELETDKASMELPAPSAGVLVKILKREGESVAVGDVIAHIDESGDGSKQDERSKAGNSDGQERTTTDREKAQTESRESRSVERGEKPREREDKSRGSDEQSESDDKSRAFPVTPSARRALREHGLRAEQVEPAGDRIRADDVERYVREHASRDKETETPRHERHAAGTADDSAETELEEIVPMSLIRRRIAARLVEAQQQAALLTTFNEVDMSAVMDLRREHRERFEEEFGVRLGFMSFFVKAAVDALRHFPEVNAEVRDVDGKLHIVYRNYYHVGVAIGSGKGLVVPVLQFAERLSFAEIEAAIQDFAHRAEANQLDPGELTGGTFTITNGGVYGSLLSTPIINPPQSGVLGMHAIQQRPVAIDGQVVIRPMMYLALTYDHRIVDGREAVWFLKRIKEAIEEPARMLIEV